MRKYITQKRLLNRLKNTRTCECCGKQFVAQPCEIKIGKARFCSHGCAYKGAPKAWLPKAVELYIAGVGCKRIGRELGVKPCTVLSAIKKTPHFQPGREKVLPRWNKGNKKPRTIKYCASNLIISEYRREAKAINKYDEPNHWSQHPERLAYLVARKHRDNKARCSNYYISSRLRTRIYCVMRGLKKSAPTLKLLGCDIATLKQHLQARFSRGMSWNNYGRVWHIDHIQPCSAFDLSKPEQQRKCFHFSNLQPMRARENWSKHARVIPCQPELLIEINGNPTK